MHYKVVVKWLIITMVVLVGFLVILLFLGYLLKENETTTTKLKAQLEQEAIAQQHKNQVREKRNKEGLSLQNILSPSDISKQEIIADNLSCQSHRECFVINTDSAALGCMVTVNTQGAIILLKIASDIERQSLSERCKQEYKNADEVVAQCINAVCTLK